MKSKMFKKLMAAVLATTMTASLAACGPAGDEPSDSTPVGGSNETTPSKDTTPSDTSDDVSDPGEVEYAPVLYDENGNVYDLGGVEIIIRDWWSDPEGAVAEPTTEEEEATQEYREWIQETYNFKIKQVGISDWGAVPQDYMDYYNGNGDSNYYAFILREDASMTMQMNAGMMYDLASLDCLDFSEKKFINGVHKVYSKGAKIYGMNSGYSEARTGVYFNKRLLEEAGIDPEEPYKLQASGQWTWDKFEEMCAKVTRDTDADGAIDIFACNTNNGMFTNMAVFSNGGEYVGKDASGNYILRLKDADTMEGLEWADKIFKNYWQVEPEADPDTGEAPAWDYYKNAFLRAEYAFLFEDAYCAQGQGWLSGMQDDFGFVMFPKGPKMNEYTNKWSNNIICIPGCYDADKAWKIAFAWNLYTNDTPGYEDSDGWKDGYYNGFRDTRAVDETIAMMREQGVYAYHTMIPDLQEGPELTWNISPTSGKVSEVVEAIADTWQAYVDAANNS